MKYLLSLLFVIFFFACTPPTQKTPVEITIVIDSSQVEIQVDTATIVLKDTLIFN